MTHFAIDFDDDAYPYVNGERGEWPESDGISATFVRNGVYVKFGVQAKAEAYAWDRMSEEDRKYFAPVIEHGESMTSRGYYIAKKAVTRKDKTPRYEVPPEIGELLNEVCERYGIQTWDITGKYPSGQQRGGSEYSNGTWRYGDNWWLVHGEPVIIDWGFNDDINDRW